MGLPPLTSEDVFDMLGSLKVAKTFDGFRGVRRGRRCINRLLRAFR